MEALATEVKTKVAPTADTVQTPLAELRPKIETIATNVSETTGVVRGQIERLDATVSEVVDRMRLQVIRADELLNLTTDRIEETCDVVHRTVVSPERQLYGLVQGVTAGLEFLLVGKRPVTKPSEGLQPSASHKLAFGVRWHESGLSAYSYPCATRTSTARVGSDPVQSLALPILGANLEPIAFAHGCRDSGNENKNFGRNGNEQPGLETIGGGINQVKPVGSQGECLCTFASNSRCRSAYTGDQFEGQARAVVCVGAYSPRGRQRSGAARTSRLVVITPRVARVRGGVDGLEAVEKTKSLKPDVVLMDISMPRMNGIEATRIIRREVPESEVILISQNDPTIVSRQAAETDASGYVAKSDLAHNLVAVMNRVVGDRSSENRIRSGVTPGVLIEP